MERDTPERNAGSDPFPTEAHLDRAVAERIRTRVLVRLARRRWRLRTARWTAASLVLLGVVGLLRVSLDGPSSGKPPPVAERHIEEEPARDLVPEVRTIPRGDAAVLAVAGVAHPQEQRREFWRHCRPLLPGKDSLQLEASGELSRYLEAVLPELSAPASRRIAHDLCREIRRRARQGVPPWIDHFLAGLGRSNVPEAWPILAAVLETTGPHSVAIQAAVDLADPRAVPALEKWLYLGDQRSEMVAEALRVTPGQESLEALLRAATTLRGRGTLLLPRVAVRIETTLHERQEEICRYLFEARPALRPVAAEVLVSIGTSDALAAIVRALEDRKLRPTARQCLVRVARKDLGPRPEAWQSWLSEKTRIWKENS